MTAPPLERRTADGGGHGGSIYDLGYRGYEGPRLGRRAAIWSLLVHSVRTAFGIGRSARSKVLPIGIMVLAVLPSLLALGLLMLVTALDAPADVVEAFSPVAYSTIFPFIAVLVFLFCASQAPELFGRDQQLNVLPLYFSRAVSRLDYAIARALGLYVSLLLVVLAPYLLLLVGRVLVAADLFDGLAEELPSVPAALAVALITAALVGALASAVASLTPRRSYATVAIIAVFLVPNVVASSLVALDTGLVGQLAAVLSPADVLDGVNAFLFDAPADNITVRRAGIDGWLYLVAAAAWIAASLAVLARRYRTMAL